MPAFEKRYRDDSLLDGPIAVKLTSMDTTGVSAAQLETPVSFSQARLPVWCGAYLLGGGFTLLWAIALTGVLLGAQLMDDLQTQDLELVMPPQLDAAPLAVTPPVKPPLQPAPKMAAPKPLEPVRQPQPLVAPTTDDSSPLGPVVTDTPAPVPNAEVAPTASVETPLPPVPVKVEPLFRLTRVPDFSNTTTLKYPDAEKIRGREGKVIAEFVINEQGAVRDIKILKSAGSLFDQAVVDELSKIKFTPPYIGARAVAARFRREFQFKLD